MSEIKKNIETCRGEDVLAEVSGLPQDPHFGSLVNEAFDPMQQQALHQAGYDGYSEVIAQHKPYTFASAIIQMKSNLLLLLRALWQFPFGSGTLRSLSDMWQHYITRLQGSETYGIPSRLSSLTDLPSAPLLVADRKISEPNAIDGISLAQQLTSDAAAALTEIKDTNHGWTMKRAIPSYFSGLKKITLGCKRWEESADRLNPMISGLTSLEEVVLEDLEYIPDDAIGSRTACSLLSGLTACHTVYADKLKRARIVYPTGGDQAVMFWNMPALKKVYMRGLDYFDVYRTGGFNIYLANQDSIEELYLGPMNNGTDNKVNLGNQTKLQKIDFQNGLNNSMNLGTWNPTDKGATFLSNFRDYIALRLADNGSGKTLTLSQTVFSSIWDANGNPQVLQDGLDQLRADIHNIVKTTKHWDVNKAN